MLLPSARDFELLRRDPTVSLDDFVDYRSTGARLLHHILGAGQVEARADPPGARHRSMTGDVEAIGDPQKYPLSKGKTVAD